MFAHLGEHDATQTDYIKNEIYQFLLSPKRNDMMTGERYYVGNHDILQRKRQVIGENGELQEVDNLPNNRVINNLYAKMVDQKNNYLLGRPISIKSDNDAYTQVLNDLLGPDFQRTLKAIGEDALNCGIGWTLIHYDENSNLIIKRIRPYELIPGWRDAEHTILDFAVRIYPVIKCEGVQETVSYRVEVYDKTGISYFEYEGELQPIEPYFEPYFYYDGKGAAWEKIPLIAWKYNNKETPLIKKVKTLQDGINLMLSNYENNMEEDQGSTIMVLHNYDGENLGEFRQNLMTYRAVKVRTTSETKGGVDTLRVDVNAENYNLILSLLKQALIENAMGYDAKDDRLSGNPNQMNIQSMYSDIDLDANSMETEFQAAFDQLLFFIDAHLANTGRGDFEDVDADIIFNRDVLINETALIDNLRNSVGLISNETLVAKHPYVNDPQAELARMKAEQAESIESLMDYQGLGGGSRGTDE